MPRPQAVQSSLDMPRTWFLIIEIEMNRWRGKEIQLLWVNENKHLGWQRQTL